jgi:hypothetical protein
VALDRSDGEFGVVLDLTTSADVSDESKRTWRVTLRDLGLAEDLRPESLPQIMLPLQVQDGLRASLKLMNSQADRPVWLKLVRPYGYLGMLPWERVLDALLERPVLRLPDFPERPRENTATLEVAIVFDPPPRVPDETASLQLKCITQELLASSLRRRTRVNVFTTSSWFERIGHSDLDEHVTVYPPSKALALAEKLGARSERRTESGIWLDWICAAVEGRSIDAVYFVGRAVATDVRKGVQISSTPSPEDDDGTVALALVNIADIGTALTRVGAWAAIFSPPPLDRGGLGMAFVADAFARSRPGAVLYHPAEPEHREGLRRGLQILFASGEAQQSRMTDGFVYCHPAAIAPQLDLRDNVLFEVLKHNETLIGKSASVLARARASVASIPIIGPIVGAPDTTQTPNWASATQRFIEGAALDQLRRNSSDILFTKTSSGKVKSFEHDKVLTDALSDIQKVVAGYLNKPR